MDSSRIISTRVISHTRLDKANIRSVKLNREQINNCLAHSLTVSNYYLKSLLWVFYGSYGSTVLLLVVKSLLFMIIAN
ncbi:hypothetical protein GQX74_003454 [Glossina fuscipes]|nr:hypothetical protein GQX74_003454 [Glossina fuscipes]